MIELAFALSSVSSQTQRASKDKEPIPIVYHQRRSAPTSLDYDAIFNKIKVDLSATTYGNQLPQADIEDESLVKPGRSFILKAPLVFLGKGLQPKIDDEDVVFFDE